MPLDPSDYRLKRDLSILKKLTLRWMTYVHTHPELGKDHCEFCSAAFSEHPTSGQLSEGYASDDKYRWICRKCFDDLREMFDWRVEGPPKSPPQA